MSSKGRGGKPDEDDSDSDTDLHKKTKSPTKRPSVRSPTRKTGQPRSRESSRSRSPRKQIETEHIPFEEMLDQMMKEGGKNSHPIPAPSHDFKVSSIFAPSSPPLTSGTSPPSLSPRSTSTSPRLTSTSPRSSSASPSSPSSPSSSSSPSSPSSSSSSSSSPSSSSSLPAPEFVLSSASTISTSSSVGASASTTSVSPMVAEMEKTLHEIISVYFEGLAEDLPAEERERLAPTISTEEVHRPPILVEQEMWDSPLLSELEVHKKAFLSINVSHVMKRCTPIFLHVSQTASEALTILSHNNFLSAPIKDSAGLIIGFLDVMGLLGLLLANETFGDSPTLLPPESLGELIERSWLTLLPPTLVRVDDSLYRAMEAMCTGPHRLLVMDQSGDQVVGLLTQSDVVNLLNRYPILLGFRATQKLGGSLAFSPNPERVLNTSPTLSAIGHIRKSNVPAVAVVDEHGYLLNAFSANSVKGLTDGLISTLHRPVEEFFNIDPALHTLQYCPVSYTIFQAIHHLAESRSHRLWVVEPLPGSHLKLIGVLTLTDIFRCLLSFESK